MAVTIALQMCIRDRTEIGEGVIVAGGAFVTKSVPAHTKVIVKNPEIKIKDSDKKIELQTTENKEGIWEI